MSLGSRLAAARAERGLDLEDVSRATRIRVPILSALEADDLAAAGPPAYARGHLRTLSGLLGLDPDVLLADYEREAPSAPAAPEAWEVRDRAVARADRGSPNWLGAAVVTAGAVVALLLVGVFVGQPRDELVLAGPQPPATAPSPAETERDPDGLVPEPPSAGGDDGATEGDEVPGDGTGGGAAGENAAGDDAAGGATTAVGDRGAAQREPSPRGSSGGSSSRRSPTEVRVSVPGGRSWLEVTDAGGRRLHAAVLESGDAEEFTAERELRLVVGNASDVRIDVDGERLDVPGGQGDVVSLRVRPGGRVTSG